MNFKNHLQKRAFCNVSLSNLENVLQVNLRTDRARKCIFRVNVGTNFRDFLAQHQQWWCLREFDLYTGLPKKTLDTLLVTIKILSFQYALNLLETSKKNFQRHSKNLLMKQPKTTMRKIHATYLLTLNCQAYLKKLSLYTSKAIGIYQIPAKFLKDSAKVLALPFRNIINLSIKLPTFHEECKIPKLKHIFKKKARTDTKNYRPISLLPLVSKVIEKSIQSQIEGYLNKKKQVCIYQ